VLQKFGLKYNRRFKNHLHIVDCCEIFVYNRNGYQVANVYVLTSVARYTDSQMTE